MVVLFLLVVALAALVLWLEWENMKVHKLLHKCDGEMLQAIGALIETAKKLEERL